jgi:hypothetical protein
MYFLVSMLSNYNKMTFLCNNSPNTEKVLFAMARKKNVSSLSQHRLDKKKGIVLTPFNDRLRDALKFTSWSKDRLPEYLWLGLILLHYGRKEGILKAGRILYEISKSINSLSYPRLSSIFNLTDDHQRIVYQIIYSVIDIEVLSPLTVLYKNKTHPIFTEYFFVPSLSVEDRIDVLSKTIELYFPPQSNEATDLRFLALSLLLFGGRLILPHDSHAIESFENYPYTEHEDEKMRIYRPTIRSMEMMGLIEDNIQFILDFWRNIGMIIPCKPIALIFDQDSEDCTAFISECQKLLEYILSTNKEKSLSDDKFHVIVGSINYALKIFIEINGKGLSNCILGRHGLRTVIEVYIILKYLLKQEIEKPNIWEEYKLYGISKYKLTLLKARETTLDNTSHFVPPIADAIVNEIMWEEFIDVDLKYFDKLGIREKSIEVSEKELYDLFYDYDSSFTHALWGAIRESAMLKCDNAAHHYHCIPDIHSSQNLPNVKTDAIKIIKKLFALLTNIYDVPQWFLDKYEIYK